MSGSPLRVGMVTSVGNRCGIAAYTAALMAEMAPLADVRLEAIQPGKQPLPHYEAMAQRLNGCDLIHVQHEYSFWGSVMPGANAFGALRAMLHKPVVVTGHTTYTAAEMLRVAEETRAPHRIAKQALLLWPPYRAQVERVPFAGGHVIVHTDEGRDALAARGLPQRLLHVLPAGIPAGPPARTGGAAFRGRFGLGSKRLVVIFGFVNPYKGNEVALQAARDWPADVALVLAGGARTPEEQPYVDQLQASLTTGGMAGRALITGYLSDEDVAEAMAAADLVLIPHTQATGSYSVTVPIFYGRPMVASDLACFSEIARDGHCILVFPAGDAARLSEAVTGLLGDASERDRMAAAALAYGRARSWRAVAEGTLGIYRQALDDAAGLRHGV